ncbi:glucuronate isomerase [Flavobacterium gawalongense]|uniref:Uronate isomerase n=1 Tax=Flavobacterium gawalongense TaxID=2594432 RepID=A0A553BAN2_9FLAO|nr:glucuronate isomerase [Flavobacterium gawalongense]TRX05308.1 glucuronate isomerase [Flavobacterium gawalongense]TRX08559.1 glucuronate isomerase [Flavobacterium gawalongense]TRX24887.1 glucuronate isomerase [Flavobacterium gawalongense]
MSKKIFISDDFLLNNPSAIALYNEYAKTQPILDYHNHLSPKDIAEDRQFENITQIWIEGDHYKWRAMRANGIDEKYITGDATDLEKFKKWAETVPYTLRNPLYHWTHMELKIYFGIEELLNAENAETIFNTCSALLQTPDFSVKNLLRKMNVLVVGTTDDPTDDLRYHKKIQDDKFEITVVPTFRPDKAVNIENRIEFIGWIDKLEKSVGYVINNFESFVNAIQMRHDFFHEMGCRISDHGHATYYASDFTADKVAVIFDKAREGKKLSDLEIDKYKSAMLLKLALMNNEKSWTQQFHVGAIRNNNSRMNQMLGPDNGFDSVGSPNTAEKMSRFFDTLNLANGLTKTIVYNLNSSESEMVAAMVANFNEAPIPGKMQYGAAWWFLDQKQGIENQLNVLSNFGLLSRFVGMVTDSRSFMSFSRHDYFRRILCNKLGHEIENGELPDDSALIGNIIENICYNNAFKYLNLILNGHKN